MIEIKLVQENNFSNFRNVMNNKKTEFIKNVYKNCETEVWYTDIYGKRQGKCILYVNGIMRGFSSYKDGLYNGCTFFGMEIYNSPEKRFNFYKNNIVFGQQKMRMSKNYAEKLLNINLTTPAIEECKYE
jgi:hypothetical protein